MVALITIVNMLASGGGGGEGAGRNGDGRGFSSETGIVEGGIQF